MFLRSSGIDLGGSKIEIIALPAKSNYASARPPARRLRRSRPRHDMSPERLRAFLRQEPVLAYNRRL
jgi:hypothetical protein